MGRGLKGAAGEHLRGLPDLEQQAARRRLPRRQRRFHQLTLARTKKNKLTDTTTKELPEKWLMDLDGGGGRRVGEAGRKRSCARARDACTRGGR